MGRGSLTVLAKRGAFFLLANYTVQAIANVISQHHARQCDFRISAFD
jgi:hypothetical protein